MQINPRKTVRDLTLEIPGATRVFEEAGIDYSCGGWKSFQEACATAGLSTGEVAQWLEQARQANIAAEDSIDWLMQPLKRLTSYIVSTHHIFTKEELARIDALLPKVCSLHGQNHPELFRIQSLFQDLNRDLNAHMQKEETILFPYIERMQEGATAGRPGPVSLFGTVQNPIRIMMMEHETDGDIMARFRQITRGFAVPDDACTSYEALYKALETLEHDLHQHIHLENNILFPRALEIEERIVNRGL